jgi:hypothetical protein
MITHAPSPTILTMKIPIDLRHAVDHTQLADFTGGVSPGENGECIPALPTFPPSSKSHSPPPIRFLSWKDAA